MTPGAKKGENRDMNVNPYLVVKNLDINQVQDETNKQFNNGYEVAEIIPVGGGNIHILFIMKTAAAQLRNASAVAGASKS